MTRPRPQRGDIRQEPTTEKIMEPLGSPPTQPGSPAHIEEPALRTVASLADLPLRRGKWTPEEQNFSEVLIQAFLAGLVSRLCGKSTNELGYLLRGPS